MGMNKDEIDYSLPYEQARAIYGTRNGNNIYFMSKDTFEKTKAKRAIDDTRAIGATKEELDYMLQNGQISKAAYEKQIAALNTPEVQKEMARGKEKADENVWDSSSREKIDDTRAIGATKEELDYMLQNGQISKAAYEKQIAALNTPEVQEAMEEGEKKADEYISELSDSDDSDDGGDGGETEPDKNYKKSMMSIWDAYRAGLIDKETAGYFTIDAIATLAKNLGRSIGNVGAQFSGGTIDNGHDESKWGQRQKAVLEEEIQKELEGLGSAAGRKAESESLDNEAKRIRNAYTPKQLEQQIEMFKKELEMADINLEMAHSKTDLIKFIKSDPDYANSPFKMGMVAYLTQNGVGGAVNNASSTLLDAMNWAITLVK